MVPDAPEAHEVPELFRLIYLGRFDRLEQLLTPDQIKSTEQSDLGQIDKNDNNEINGNDDKTGKINKTNRSITVKLDDDRLAECEACVLYLDQLGRFEDALTMLEQISMKHGPILEAQLRWRQGDLRTAQRVIEVIDPSDLRDSFWKSFWYNVAGNIAWRQGRFGDSVDHHQQALVLREGMGFTPLVTLSLNNIGTVLYSQGLNEEARSYFLRALDSIGDEFNPNVKGAVLNNIASVHSSLGQLTQAMDYHQQALGIKQMLANPTDIAYSLNNLGVICFKMGDMTQAQEYYVKALDIRLRLDNPRDLVVTYANLARVHYAQRRLDEAFEMMSLCIVGSEGVSNLSTVASLYYWMIKILLKLKRIKAADEYLQILAELASDNPVVAGYQDMAQVDYLLAQPGQKTKATPYLDRLLSGEVVRHDIHVSALLARCELLLYQYQVSGDDDIFNLISTELDRLYQTAQDQRSHSLVIETILLKSRFLLLQGSYGDLDLVLEQAHIYAEERGLVLLAERVEHERILVLQEFSRTKQNPNAAEPDTLDYLDMVRAFLDAQ